MNGRSPFWYKSGGFLWGVFAGGLIVVAGASGPLLYQQHLDLVAKQQRVAAMKKLISEHKTNVKLAGSESELRIPTQEELSNLQKQIPVEADIPLLIKEIQEKVAAAGMKWTGARFASTSEELNQARSKEETAEQKLKDEIGKSLQNTVSASPYTLPAYVKAVWADIYVDGSIPQLKTWFEKLKESERTIRVVEWENQIFAEDAARGNTRVRLVFYVYQDPELKIPNLPAASTTTPASTETIQILPPGDTEPDQQEKKEEEKQTDPSADQSENLANPPSSKKDSRDTGSVTSPTS